MEIERKFLIDWNQVTALPLPLVRQAESWQGYLSAATPVVRIRRRDLEDGHLLECNLVDGKFAYAEVEFDSIEEAERFQMPPFLLKDVTEDPYYSMSGYWRRHQITVSFEL